jgi:hypothetical protein
MMTRHFNGRLEAEATSRAGMAREGEGVEAETLPPQAPKAVQLAESRVADEGRDEDQT